MSNNHDEDDWSNDSASLFREARRAHDPTSAESAQLAAVLARIQAATPQTTTETPFAANRSADAARGATSQTLHLVASVSLGVAFIAAAYFAFIRVDRHPSEPARSAKHATPAEVPSGPPSIATPPAPVPPAPAPSRLPSAPAQASAARDEPQSRSRSQRRRPRATAETQRTSPIETAAAPEAPSSASHDNSRSATVPQNSDTLQKAAPPATSLESIPKEPVTSAPRKADPTLPQTAPTELATMKRIQAALRDADFSTALTLCADHARRWPHGVFELEREGVRAIASCGGNSDDAALRAKRFLTTHPHAPVAMRVRTACAAQLMKR
jgi:hypothetical protein